MRAEDQAAAARRPGPRLVGLAGTGERGRASGGGGPAATSRCPHLGLDEATYSGLAGRVTHIIHSAADLRVDAPIDELRKTNVQGTANVLELARAVQRDHGLERYAHVSTAYVAGGRSGAIPEADLTEEYGFSNAYELSKYEGERLVQAAKSELPISVFRPGMIVGARGHRRDPDLQHLLLPAAAVPDRQAAALSRRIPALPRQHRPGGLRGRSRRAPDLLTRRRKG